MKRHLKKSFTGILGAYSDEIDKTSFSNLNRNLSKNYLQIRNTNSRCFSQVTQSNKQISLCKQFCAIHKPQTQFYSTSSEDFPPLTSLPKELHPGVFIAFSCLFQEFLVIKPNLDSSFNLIDFVLTSKKVVEIVSHKLAVSDIEGISDMMTSNTLTELKTNLPKFSVFQRQQLATSAEDIIFSAVHSITVTDEPQNNSKYLQIYTIHHTMKDANEIRKNINALSLSQLGNVRKSLDEKTFVVNYRFIRRYSENGAGDWLLNGLNHYKKSANNEFSLF